MTKGDAWIWIGLIVVVGGFLVAPYLRQRPDWINWVIVVGGVVALVVVLMVFPLH